MRERRWRPTYSAPARIFAGSQSASSPFSIPAAMTPSGRLLLTLPQARRLNLTHQIDISHREDVSPCSPGAILHETFWTTLSLPAEVIFISVKEIRCPDFELAFVTE
jgi:hypothetical protein